MTLVKGGGGREWRIRAGLLCVFLLGLETPYQNRHDAFFRCLSADRGCPSQYVWRRVHNILQEVPAASALLLR